MKGASQDFETWYEQTHPRLLSTLTVVCGSVDIARDATDEAFVRALERWPRVSRMHSPEGWTYRVALNLIRRTTRRARHELTLAARVSAPPPSSSWDPDLWACVRALPERERLAVALRYVADLPAERVADLMGVAVGTVWSTLDHARRHLRETLEPTANDQEDGHG